MPEKKAKATTPKDETIDFESEESRYTFLRDHLNSLMDGINGQYGKEIMAELLQRLEHTVDEFNHQLSNLLGQLQEGKMRDYLEGDVAADEFMLSSNGAGEPKETVPVEEAESPNDAEDNEIIKRLEARVRGKRKR